jgi:hypothetical protein
MIVVRNEPHTDVGVIIMSNASRSDKIPPSSSRSIDILRFRCPTALPAAVRRAARRRMLSNSAYMRLAIVERLKVDGIDIDSQEAR